MLFKCQNSNLAVQLFTCLETCLDWAVACQISNIVNPYFEGLKKNYLHISKINKFMDDCLIDT